MAYLSLDPVSVGVNTVLNVAALQALATGGIFDDIPQEVSFPCVLYEVSENRDLRGFGTGGLPEIDLRVHTYGLDKIGLQAINQKAIQLLRDVRLSVSGYNTCAGVFYDDTLTFDDELINGVKVHELVSRFRIYVQES